MKLEALKKILGRGVDEIGGAASGLGAVGKGAAGDVSNAIMDLRTGGKLKDVLSGLKDSAKYSGKGLAGVAKRNPYGTAALGAGAVGAAGAGAYGINELLEELGLAEDEEEEEGYGRR